MAEVKVLLKGYLMEDSSFGKGSCSTISLIKDEDLNGEKMIMIVDPGTTKSQDLIQEALKKEGLDVKDVTHVGITHGHMDHYRNIGMFPNAKCVNYDGIWDGDVCEYSNEREEVRLTDNISVLKTPGHSYDSITFLINVEEGTSKGKVAVCGDVFWKKDYPLTPSDDSYAENGEFLKLSREKVLKMADFVIPGHGEMYKV